MNLKSGAININVSNEEIKLTLDNPKDPRVINAIEEGQRLYGRVSQALWSMKQPHPFRHSCCISISSSISSSEIKESEVSFRYDAIVGILIMAQNDISEMLRSWEKEA